MLLRCRRWSTSLPSFRFSRTALGLRDRPLFGATHSPDLRRGAIGDALTKMHLNNRLREVREASEIDQLLRLHILPAFAGMPSPSCGGRRFPDCSTRSRTRTGHAKLARRYAAAVSPSHKETLPTTRGTKTSR